MPEKKIFTSTHTLSNEINKFTEDTAPTWLTSNNTIVGSTMDHRFFWEENCLKLKVGESVNTDFHVIKRIS